MFYFMFYVDIIFLMSCIVETSDGFAVNIGPCDGNPGEFIVATYDAKVKEREALMNPTGR